MKKPFGFEVIEITEPIYDESGKWIGSKPTGTYSVVLPHQCDSWEIVGDYSTGLNKEEAIAELQRFIDEATDALEELKELD